MRLGRAALGRLGTEIREARRDRGLSIDTVAAAARLSNAEVSRIERGLSPGVPFLTLGRLAAVVGLDLSARLYPGPSPIRDAAQISLLGAFRRSIDPRLAWATEVPFSIPGDQRAWDATIAAATWRVGVEAETAPRDAQALLRRLALKERDGAVDSVILVLPESRRARDFLRDSGIEMSERFPIPSKEAAARLRDGQAPGGSAVIVVARAEAQRHLGPTSKTDRVSSR